MSYTTPGTYTVTWHYNDGNGNESTQQQTAIVTTEMKCPLGQGYWRNHLNAWPVNSLTLGRQTYSKTTLLAILKTTTTAEASLILARQLIAAILNVANGADPGPISGAIVEANSLLSGFGANLPYKVAPSSTTGQATQKQKYPTAESIFKESDVKDHPPTIYQHPIEQVRPAAARALSFVGCKIERQEDFYPEGKRPQKWGFFIGSGGETVKAFLYPKTTNETHVSVDTDLSFVGIAGQQGWSKQVIAELTCILGKQ